MQKVSPRERGDILYDLHFFIKNIQVKTVFYFFICYYTQAFLLVSLKSFCG
ncbi:hypothetical protein LDG_5571 [Legionella drancourtii LLAP12]|uniref:Uncharacterized protein n=1 Tax=Legionella drancourtii LLAP12 TaxID=658187 RepID=G9EK48_9GAMM|nr:hypothetical protein LDG_5571 [Legionella drancourtii LLAP12]